MSSSQRKLGSLTSSVEGAESDPSFRWGDEVGNSMKGGWTYILTNKTRGVLYIGVTGDIAARMMQHRTGKGSAFARKYGLNILVLVEWHDSIEEGISREKALKAWKRDWRIELIEKSNPEWRDLFDTILA